MPGFDRDWGDWAQQWEVFFHQFIAYVFHTEEGRQIRWRFLRETLARTLTYMVGAVPIVVILWYFRLFSTSSFGFNVAVSVLIFDLTFGVAFLRTVYKYRHRVKMVYHLHFGDEDGPRRPSAANQDVDIADLLPADDEAEAPSPPADELEEVEPPDEDAIEMQVTLQCTRCGREMSIPAEGFHGSKPCTCGGKMLEV